MCKLREVGGLKETEKEVYVMNYLRIIFKMMCGLGELEVAFIVYPAAN
jgi:hypothetical protein